MNALESKLYINLIKIYIYKDCRMERSVRDAKLLFRTCEINLKQPHSEIRKVNYALQSLVNDKFKFKLNLNLIFT